MKRLTLVMVVVAAIVGAGCAGRQPPPASTAPGQAFTGEVWTWDEQTNTVTLRQGNLGERLVHVKITPDQIARLRMHQITTVRGELAPVEIERFVLPPGTLVPRGPLETAEVSGLVTGVDPAGTVSVRTAGGTVVVWVAKPGTAPFHAGDPVRVRAQTQAYDVVPAGPPGSAGPGPVPPLAAPAGGEPGEYAAVRGPLSAVDPQGRLTVQTPRGPVIVPVPSAAPYQVGEWVEVRTAVHSVR